MRRIPFLLLGLAALLAGGAPAQAKWVRPPPPDPADFVAGVTNPFFPLDPGTIYRYEGEEDGEAMSDEVHVTHRTIGILGIECVVVHDQAFDADGVLVEDTYDYYAQDVLGNVWYMGEDTAELDAQGNVVTTEGTWRAGVDGAEPGILMEAHPRKGDHYRQEHLEGVAEDEAEVLSLDESICVDYGCFDGALLTKEWSPLERGVVEHKYYAEGVGFLYSEIVQGGDEKLELVEITHG